MELTCTTRYSYCFCLHIFTPFWQAQKSALLWRNSFSETTESEVFEAKSQVSGGQQGWWRLGNVREQMCLSMGTSCSVRWNCHPLQVSYLGSGQGSPPMYVRNCAPNRKNHQKDGKDLPWQCQGEGSSRVWKRHSMNPWTDCVQLGGEGKNIYCYQRMSREKNRNL